MAMALPPIGDVLRGITGWVSAHRGGTVRALILLSLWGMAVFGWASLGEQALLRRMPPVQEAAARYAVTLGDYFTQRISLLRQLAVDPRLAQGLASEETVNSLEVRRALYEFSYLKRLTQLYLYDETSGRLGQLASSRPLPEAVMEWLHNMNERPVGLTLVDMPDAPTFYTAMHLTGDDAHGYVLMPAGWSNILATLPPLPEVRGYKDTELLLVLNTGGEIWGISPSPRIPPKPFDILRPQDMTAPQILKPIGGGVTVTTPVSGFPGWNVALQLPASAALGTSRMAQWLAVLVAFLGTLAVLWRPSLPIRRRVAKTVVAPVVEVVRPLATPVLSSIAAVVEGRRQPPVPIIADPEPEEATGGTSSGNNGGMATPKRMRMMNLGSTAAASGKPIVAASITRDKNQFLNKESMAPPPNDALADLVDECLMTNRSQLLYQPIYRTLNGEPSMHEVLLRLIDRDGNPMTPAVFIPVCQQYGWMDRIDAHVVQRVLDLNFAGGAQPVTPLALNISGDTLDNVRYLETLMEAEKEKGDIMKNLIFEVRSQELMQDPKAMSFLHECRDRGVKLSVDYFGGGKQMMEASKKLGFDFVKMDCLSFGTDDNAKKELIVLCRAAKQVDLPVVLEKMETVAMEVFARRIGVHYLQGYLLGKPKADMVTQPLPGWRAMAGNDAEETTPAEDPAADAPPPADPDSDAKP